MNKKELTKKRRQSIDYAPTFSNIFSLYFKNIVVVTTIAFIFIVIPLLLSEFLPDSFSESIIYDLTCCLFLLTMIGALVPIYRFWERSEKASLKEVLGDLYPVLFNLVLVSLIKILIVAVGLVFFLIPGIYLYLRLSFVEALVVDQKISPIQSIKDSFSMTRSINFHLIGFPILFCFITIAFLIAGIGLFLPLVFLLNLMPPLFPDSYLFFEVESVTSFFSTVLFTIPIGSAIALGSIWPTVCYFRVLDHIKNES